MDGLNSYLDYESNIQLLALLWAGIKNQLRTSEQGDRFIAGLIRYLCIPHLGRPAVMYLCSDAGDPTLAGGIQEIAL